SNSGCKYKCRRSPSELPMATRSCGRIPHRDSRYEIAAAEAQAPNSCAALSCAQAAGRTGAWFPAKTHFHRHGVREPLVVHLIENHAIRTFFTKGASNRSIDGTKQPLRKYSRNSQHLPRPVHTTGTMGT